CSVSILFVSVLFFFFQAEDGIRDFHVTGVQTCALPILFILLDATWTEARKMFRKSPYLDGLPVLSLQPEQLSRYQLRRSTRAEHLCTAEVAALCLELAGDASAATALGGYFDLFTEHYLAAKHKRVLDVNNASHREMQAFI